MTAAGGAMAEFTAMAGHGWTHSCRVRHFFENTAYRTARTGALPFRICRTQWYQSKAYDMSTLLAVFRSEFGAMVAKL